MSNKRTQRADKAIESIILRFTECVKSACDEKNEEVYAKLERVISAVDNTLINYPGNPSTIPLSGLPLQRMRAKGKLLIQLRDIDEIHARNMALGEQFSAIQKCENFIKLFNS